jgi:hypothetical protein
VEVRLPRRFYLLILLLLAAAVVGSYFAFLRDRRRHKTLAREVPAKITKTEVRHDIDPETGVRRLKDTIVTFEYEINGQRYERVTRIGRVAASSFVPWDFAKVCYDPLDIKAVENPELFPKGYNCGT